MQITGKHGLGNRSLIDHQNVGIYHLYRLALVNDNYNVTLTFNPITRHDFSGFYTWVPKQSWDCGWFDEMLYKKYGITEEENRIHQQHDSPDENSREPFGMSKLKRKISPQNPEELFGWIVSILEQARGNVVRAVNSNRVQAYWLIGREASLYFWCDNKGHEADLVLERQRHLVPIEIKSSMTWHTDFAKNIHWMQKNLPDVDHGQVIYAGDLTPETDSYAVRSFTKAAGIFAS